MQSVLIVKKVSVVVVAAAKRQKEIAIIKSSF